MFEVLYLLLIALGLGFVGFVAVCLLDLLIKIIIVLFDSLR